MRFATAIVRQIFGKVASSDISGLHGLLPNNVAELTIVRQGSSCSWPCTSIMAA